jgi:hypothetical protein
MKARISSDLPERIETILTTEPWQATDEPFGFDRQGLEEVAAFLTSGDSRGVDLGTLPLWHYLRRIYDGWGIKDRICQAILATHPNHFRLITTLVPDLSDEMLSIVVDHFLNNPDLWDRRLIWVIECIAGWAPRILHPHLGALRDVLREIHGPDEDDDEDEFEGLEAALGGAPDNWVKRYERSENLKYLGRIRTPPAREALLRLVGRIDTTSRYRQWIVDWLPAYNGLFLDEHGARLLLFPRTYRGVIARAGHSPHRVCISLRSFHCQRCGTPARLLLALDIAALDLGHEIRGASHIPMITCECSDLVQARVLNDRIELLGDHWQVTADEPVMANEQSLHLVPHRNQWGMDYSVPHAMHQVGGFPAWVQDPEYPTCAGCGKVMSFVAQVDSSDNMGHCFWGEGMCYVFWCDDCAIAATLYQQT